MAAYQVGAAGNHFHQGSGSLPTVLSAWEEKCEPQRCINPDSTSVRILVVVWLEDNSESSAAHARG
jgi:hypothetical protein